MDIPIEFIHTLSRASKIVVLTGAGMSAESGVPTFRDAQTGLWEKYSAEELATPEAFLRNPQLVWQWYQERRKMVARAEPNSGHLALAEMERMLSGLTVVTQNVDGLHQVAGSHKVIELHGNIMASRCFDYGHHYQANLNNDDFWNVSEPPVCQNCGSLIRPTVVWFGEALPEEALDSAWQLISEADVVLSVGTSTLVQPAASLPFEALSLGIPVVEINLHPTPLSDQAPFMLQGKSGEVLPQLLSTLKVGMKS